ncbi:MAG: 3-phosphoserine/phosphohydroxythreonine transaminase [Pseudomonadota bacterium]|nr:3-phosphoserine/phosphohydroxythreonine transaminase [Pseudomonadota bacterium]
MSKRVHNFSAGPCTLPLQALEAAQQEFVDYHGAGMSLIEMSHRSKQYDAVHQDARALALKLWGAPDDFDVLFIQGGATLQFAMLPMNLLTGDRKGAYAMTGTWAKGAFTDGSACCDVYPAWNGARENFTRMPKAGEIEIRDDTRYLHITSNETIGGIRYPEFPDVGVPLVADMSSEMLARPIPWELFDIVYGGAQKNLGPAGVGIVFIRKSILEETNHELPRYLRYDIHQTKESLFNTPPVFAIYMVGKVLKWMEAEGGLPEMERRAEEKSSLLYGGIDNSGGYYRCPVDTACRSRMNVVFRLPDEAREQKFLAKTAEAGLLSLKGHRSVGGCRASIYNAMPLAGVQALAEFMDGFQAENP